MSTLKKILIGIGIIIAIPFVVALFLPKSYLVERSVSIAKPASETYNYVKFLKNQDNYSVWAMKDLEMKKSYSGEDGKVGFVSRWESKNEELGVGEQEIKMLDDTKMRIETELRFFEPFESTEQSYMTVTAIDNKSSKVLWGFNGNLAYPMNLMCLFMDFEQLIGKDFEEGLANLKLVLEK
ncbi:MAG: SRPBCC family protein [Leptospira sp.]|nr:SRPBCC family protein [Leptospira sp.]